MCNDQTSSPCGQVYGPGELERRPVAKLRPHLPYLWGSPFLALAHILNASVLASLWKHPVNARWRPACQTSRPLGSHTGAVVRLWVPASCPPCLCASLGLTVCHSLPNSYPGNTGGLWFSMHRKLLLWVDNLASRDAPTISVPRPFN